MSLLGEKTGSPPMGAADKHRITMEPQISQIAQIKDRMPNPAS